MDPAAQAKKIFDLLDINNVVQAETTLETALKKFPTHHALLAAESFVDLRNNKHEQARDKASLLACRSDVTDPLAIDALAHVLQQTAAFEPLAVMYSRIAALLPNSTNLHENLFQTYLRIGRFDEGQRVALTLHKKCGGEARYQAWAVMAMLAQVPPDSKDHLLLKVSTKMLETSIITSKGVVTTETCKTLFDVLVQQQRFDDALAFVCGEFGSKMGLVERRLEAIREVYLAQGKTAHAAAVAKVLWKLNSDDWTYFEWYLSTITSSSSSTTNEGGTLNPPLLLCNEPKSPFVLQCDSTHAQAMHFCNELQELECSERGKKMRRGPFLAHLELLLKFGSGTELQEELLKYCERFSSKPTCFMDIAKYVSSNQPARDAVVSWCSKTSESVPVGTAVFHQLKLLQHKVDQLRVGCEVPRDDDTVRREMNTLVTLYHEAATLSTSLGWSEEGVCDGYITCALTLAVKQYLASGKQRKWLLLALDAFRQTSRTLNNPSWLLIAVHLQRLLGVCDTKLTKQLDFKSVQCESMFTCGYTPLLDSSCVSELERWHSEAYKFYNSVTKDTSVLRVKVFRFFTWTTWRDLLGFEKKMSASLVRVEMLADYALSNLRACQTMRYMQEHFESFSREVKEALTMMTSKAPSAPSLLINDDLLSVKATMVVDVQAPQASLLAEGLLYHEDWSKEARLERAKGKLLLFCLLRDHSAKYRARQDAKNAPKASKSKSTAAPAAETSNTTSALLTETFAEEMAGARWPPLMSPLAPLMAQSLLNPKEVIRTDEWKNAMDRMIGMFHLLAEEDGGGAVAETATTTVHALLDHLGGILLPSCYALSGLLQTAAPDVVPVALIAEGLRTRCIVPARQKLEVLQQADGGAHISPVIAEASEIASGGLADELRLLFVQRAHHLNSLMEDLSADLTVASKRR